MTIVHIVLFKPNPSLSKDEVREVGTAKFPPTSINARSRQLYNDMMNLKDTCIHPTTKKPYIKSFKGGKDNSPEGKQV